jgi:hypothetical protein
MANTPAGSAAPPRPNQSFRTLGVATRILRATGANCHHSTDVVPICVRLRHQSGWPMRRDLGPEVLAELHAAAEPIGAPHDSPGATLRAPVHPRLPAPRDLSGQACALALPKRQKRERRERPTSMDVVVLSRPRQAQEASDAGAVSWEGLRHSLDSSVSALRKRPCRSNAR